MGFFERINKWLGRNQGDKPIPNAVLLSEQLDKARRAQYMEDYEEALSHLTEAMRIAESEYDIRANVDITLSRADILTAQGDYETATFILNELLEETEAREMIAPQAYTLCSLGVVEQHQGHLEAAQARYETARELADSINTDGASGRAAAHLADIYLAQGNASYAIYLLEDAVQKLDGSGDRELLGYFLGQLGLALIESGRKEDGVRRLQRGREVASVLKHHGQMRYLNRLLGQQALTDGDYRRAQTYFEDALVLYLAPPPENTEFVSLLCEASQASIRLGDVSKARSHAETALPLAEAIGDENLIAMAKASLGLVLSSTEEDGALQYLRDAAIAYQASEPDSFYVDILRHLAAEHIREGNDAMGVDIFKKAIAIVEPSSAAATVHGDLAEYYAKQRQFRDAIEQWQFALNLYQEVNQIDAVVRVHSDIAALYERVGDGRMAQREYGNALEKLSRVEERATRGIVLANVAAAFSEYGDLDSAEAFFKEAIDIAHRNRNVGAEFIRRGNYGRLLALTNRGKQALIQLDEAQGLDDDLDLPLQSSILLGNFGLAHVALDDFETSVEYYRRANEQLLELDAPKWEAINHANWGDALFAQGAIGQALDHYQQAHRLAEENTAIDGLIQSSIGIARVALLQSNIEQAQTTLTEISPIAKRQGYRRLLALLYQAWSELYAKQGNAEQAASSWEEAKKLRSIMRMKPITPDWL